MQPDPGLVVRGQWCRVLLVPSSFGLCLNRISFVFQVLAADKALLALDWFVSLFVENGPLINCKICKKCVFIVGCRVFSPVRDKMFR